MKPKTDKNGIRVMSTVMPDERPDFDKWSKKMRIAPTVWYEHPEGKQRAKQIMEPVGVEIKTLSEVILNK